MCAPHGGFDRGAVDRLLPSQDIGRRNQSSAASRWKRAANKNQRHGGLVASTGSIVVVPPHAPMPRLRNHSGSVAILRAIRIGRAKLAALCVEWLVRSAIRSLSALRVRNSGLDCGWSQVGRHFKRGSEHIRIHACSGVHVDLKRNGHLSLARP